MSARVLFFPAERLRAGSPRAGSQCASVNDAARAMHFWRGASGHGYVHTVYSLIACPPLPAANYVFARRDAHGQPVALGVGRVRHEASTSNLAELRHRGAHLGATEVHIHLLASGDLQSLAVELDLEAAGHLPPTMLDDARASAMSA